MAYEQPDILNLENNKAIRLPRYQYSIEIVDLENQQVLHQRTDYGGFHTCGAFTEDENIIIYLTFDKHWYIPPVIKIWDLKNDSIEEIITSHDTQSRYLTLAYHNTTQRLILGGFDGNISAYDMRTREEIWLHENLGHCIILALAFSECGEKIAVLQKEIFTIYDFISGKILLSTPLLDEYSTCQFQEKDLVIHISHPEKETIKINCKEITR
jgi:WD40 repeat protein